jgi:hypothetical protein
MCQLGCDKATAVIYKKNFSLFQHILPFQQILPISAWPTHGAVQSVVCPAYASVYVPCCEKTNDGYFAEGLEFSHIPLKPQDGSYLSAAQRAPDDTLIFTQGFVFEIPP